jgi:hypothetical protein
VRNISFLSTILELYSVIVGWGTMLEDGKSRVRFPMRPLDFSIDLIFQPQYGPGVDSASNRNEYQESSWGGGGVRAAGA